MAKQTPTHILIISYREEGFFTFVPFSANSIESMSNVLTKVLGGKKIERTKSLRALDAAFSKVKEAAETISDDSGLTLILTLDEYENILSSKEKTFTANNSWSNKAVDELMHKRRI